MKIFQEPVDKYFNTNEPRSIVLHTTLGGTALSSIGWLRQPQVEASYHYIVDKYGTIYQLVKVKHGAWHAGRFNRPNLRARTFYGTDKVNVNSVGIAFARNGEAELTEEQLDATIWLIKDIGRRIGYRYTADNIFAHKEIAIDKPAEVLHYREQVLDALIGEKDEKDSEERSKMLQIVQLLQLIIKLYGRKYTT